MPVFNKGSCARTDIIYISAEQQKGTTKDVLCAIGLVIVSLRVDLVKFLKLFCFKRQGCSEAGLIRHKYAQTTSAKL